MPVNPPTSPKARTASINVSAFLISRGIQLDHAEPRDGRVEFVFNISPEALDVQTASYHSGATVPAFQLLSALTQLKRLVKQILA